jgi:hypothetical protein
VFTVDTTKDGKADSIQIKVLNLILPFVVPKNLEIGDFDLNSFDMSNINLSDQATLFLDDEPLKISGNSVDLETVKDRFLIIHKGESFTLDDILQGKLSGRMIALGDTVSVLIKIDTESLKVLNEGKHTFRIESELISNLSIDFELDESNMNIAFDPQNP